MLIECLANENFQLPTMQSDITEPSFTKQSHCARGQSCSPSRHEPRHSDNKYLFSTVRRTRSPFRKQNQDQSISIRTSKRPPLPKKFMHTAGVFEQPIDKLEVSNYAGCQQWLPQSQLTNRVANNSTIGNLWHEFVGKLWNGQSEFCL